MRNLKKILAVVIAVALVMTSMTAAFAAADDTTYTYSAEAQKLYDLGLYNGVSQTSFDPDLGATLNRETGITLLLRIFGLEAEAKAMSDEDVDAALANFEDAANISTWAKNSVAYAVVNGITNGVSETSFAPADSLTANQYATFIMRQLGYVDVDWKLGAVSLSEVEGSQVPTFEDPNAAIIKDGVIGITFGALSAKDIDGISVIEALVAAEVVTADAAKAAGFDTTPPVVAKALDIKRVAALNSKMAEIELDTAATAADVAAAKFAIKDASGKELVVSAAAISPWSTSGKAVLITFASDTTSGTLYTMTVDGKNYNFGGKPVDTVKPGVLANNDGVVATDANEVTITFDESVKIETLKVTLNESFGSKEALAVNGMKYNGSNSIILSVGDMKSATLYSYTITDVTDLVGNQQDGNKKEGTFVGFAKPTDNLKFNGDSGAVKAAASYCDEIAVYFNVNVDPSTLTPENFTINESFGSKTAVAVKSVKVGVKDSINTTGGKIASDAAGRKYAILTVEPTMKDATLYQIKFNNLKTLYGVAQSSTEGDYTTTFVGKKKPSDPFVFVSNNVGSSSNTKFSINVKDVRIDEALAENIANYTLEEAYGSKATLAITKVELDSNLTTITFTTAAMKPVLYKLTVSNLKDIYGNAVKTADSANVISVAGKDVASKISSIASISRYLPTNSNSSITMNDALQIYVEFDQSVGSNAKDVSLYTIDNGVGYPTKVDTFTKTDGKTGVILTIGKTNEGTTYKLTVKGLLNADEVAMDSAGVSASFPGKGNAYGMPKMQAIVATDNQTIKIYFDRSVDGADIKGATKIWDADALTTNMKYKYANVGSLANVPTNKAWKDPENSNVLIVRTLAANTFKSSTTSGSQFILDASASGVLDSNNNKVVFAGNDSDVAKPQIIAVMANDKKTVTLYFDQAVNVTSAAVNTYIKVGTSEDALTNPVTVSAVGMYKVDDKTYKFVLDGTLENKTYYVNVTNLAAITDKSGYATLKPKNDGGSFAAIQFGGATNAADDKISSVNIMMTDKNTIEVYYPEKMDFDTVTNPANYKIFKKDDGTGADNISVPTTVLYDGDNKKATLYLNSATIGGAVSGTNTYYLAVSSAIKNEVGLKNIKDDKSFSGYNCILVPFAYNTSDNAKPTVSSVAVDLNITTKVAIEFNGPVLAGTTSASIVTSGAISGSGSSIGSIAAGSATWDPTEYTGTAIFKVYNITASDDTSTPVTVVKTYKVGNNKFELELATAIDKDKTYKLVVEGNVYNLAGTQVETASDKTIKVVFTATK